MIGAVPLSPPTSARIGKGPFLLEGDEYPSSNTDDRSKFLHYHPSHLLVAPLAHDHVNVFPTVEDYLAPFAQIASMTPAEGLMVVSTSGELSARFLSGIARPVITYGIDSGDWRARDIVWGERTVFTITHNGTEWCASKRASWVCTTSRTSSVWRLSHSRAAGSMLKQFDAQPFRFAASSVDSTANRNAPAFRSSRVSARPTIRRAALSLP